MLRIIAKLENLRPAPGPQGVLKKVDRGDGFYAYMTEDWGKYFPFPTTWKLHFDGEVPDLPETAEEQGAVGVGGLLQGVRSVVEGIGHSIGI